MFATNEQVFRTELLPDFHPGGLHHGTLTQASYWRNATPWDMSTGDGSAYTLISRNLGWRSIAPNAARILSGIDTHAMPSSAI